MSIVTKTGDSGTTGLMYNRRVPKDHPRIEACGAVDELNSALGLGRAATADTFLRAEIELIQKDLIILMGELATTKADLARYVADGFAVVSGPMTARLEQTVRQLEARNVGLPGWATPGANPCAAALDLARSICRRSERRVCALAAGDELPNGEIGIYLNRLADLLWLLARWAETLMPA